MPVLRSADARSRRTRGHAVVDALGQPHPAQRLDGHGEVRRREPPGPAVLGEHQRPRVGVACDPGVEHHGKARASTDRHGDHVAGLEAAQGVGGGFAAVGDPLAGQRLLPLGDAAAQVRVLGEVAEVAAHRRRVPGEGFAVALDPPGQADDRAVGLELAERLLQQLPRRVDTQPADEVDRHVVAGPEGAAQRVGAGGGEARDLLGVDAGLPDHDGVALDVDPAPSGPPGELGVLARGELGVALAVELHEAFEHHGAGGHVDAQRQRLGGEHRPDEAADEQLLDGLLERGQQARVVGRDAPLQRLAPLPVAQHGEVALGQLGGAAVDRGADLAPPRRRW